uniref:Uncharacterized protein n=1 Tax=Lygus hesperus TaxID=30085 RepID=A0A0K8T4X8_LYGHE
MYLEKDIDGLRAGNRNEKLLGYPVCILCVESDFFSLCVPMAYGSARRALVIFFSASVNDQPYITVKPTNNKPTPQLSMQFNIENVRGTTQKGHFWEISFEVYTFFQCIVPPTVFKILLI